VVGNNSLDNVTNNLLTILEAMGRSDLPVAMGAATSLTQAAVRLAASVHGPDGLWGVGLRHPHDLSPLPRDVPALYRDLAESHPGATLVALGPLTNVALAFERYPDSMRRFERLVILGGAWRGGNVTPVAEFNVWRDAEAAARVFASGVPIDLVTLDAFQQFTLEPEHIQALSERGNAGAQLLAPALQGYLKIQLSYGRAAAIVPDVAAMMYALDSELGQARSGLVRVVTDSRLALGQTIIGFDAAQRVPLALSAEAVSGMIERSRTEPGFDLFAEVGARAAQTPDNAQVIMEIDAGRMRALFLEALLTGQ
jgi:pyrimidine-specific ribonucleoside hydrolase